MARQKALGIGGLFVRAQDPAALSQWYHKHLGINPVPTSYEDKPWVQEEGPTIFSPMPDSAGMIPEGKSWMLNLRVADLDAFAAQLKADGVAVEVDPKTYPNGRFATLADPEGNPIQLWEPALP
ncbi:MAG: VOC family protein [Pseudomonadota bacterium]